MCVRGSILLRIRFHFVIKIAYLFFFHSAYSVFTRFRLFLMLFFPYVVSRDLTSVTLTLYHSPHSVFILKNMNYCPKHGFVPKQKTKEDTHVV